MPIAIAKPERFSPSACSSQVSCIEIVVFFIEVAVSQGFTSPNDNPLIGPDICALLKMQGRLTSAIVNHNQVIARGGRNQRRGGSRC